MTPGNLNQRAQLYWNAGYQLHTHVNGDLGLETVLNVLERRMRENPRADHRSVIVHFACSTEEQVERIARLGAIVSANPYYHRGFRRQVCQVRTRPRTRRCHGALRLGAETPHPALFHSDLPWDPARRSILSGAAVNRVTPSGRVAAPSSGSAWQTPCAPSPSSRRIRGGRRTNSAASLPARSPTHVLEQDPLAVDPMQLNDLADLGHGVRGQGSSRPRPQVRRRGPRRDPGQVRKLAGHDDPGESHLGCPCEVAQLVASALLTNSVRHHARRDGKIQTKEGQL